MTRMGGKALAKAKMRAIAPAPATTKARALAEAKVVVGAKTGGVEVKAKRKVAASARTGEAVAGTGRVTVEAKIGKVGAEAEVKRDLGRKGVRAKKSNGRSGPGADSVGHVAGTAQGAKAETESAHAEAAAGVDVGPPGTGAGVEGGNARPVGGVPASPPGEAVASSGKSLDVATAKAGTSLRRREAEAGRRRSQERAAAKRGSLRRRENMARRSHLRRRALGARSHHHQIVKLSKKVTLKALLKKVTIYQTLLRRSPMIMAKQTQLKFSMSL